MSEPAERARAMTEADDRALRRDIDRWLDEGMTADQYRTFRLHVGRIEDQAATEARRELLAKVEGLPLRQADVRKYRAAVLRLIEEGVTP